VTRVERIIEARRKLDAGEFNREVVAVEPDDLSYDLLTLECGHKTVIASSLRRTLNRKGSERVTCHKCANAWIDG
jgi:hypothetical protein